MSLRSVLSITIFLCYSFIVGQNAPDPTQICPLTLKIEKGDQECAVNCEICFPAEKYSGKTLVLTNRAKVFIDDDGFYQCNCSYGIPAEDREIINCRTGEKEETTAWNEFLHVLLFKWVEPPLNTSPAVCAFFKNRYGYSAEPFLDQNNFDILNSTINFSFLGQSSATNAVVMGTPWEDTDFFSAGHLHGLPEVQAAFDRVKQRAVSYATCRSVVNRTPTFFDLNPKFAEGFTSLEEIRSVSTPVALEGKLTKLVNGTTADGISEMLVVIPAQADTRFLPKGMEPETGQMLFPWGEDRFSFAGGDFYVGIYRPPDAYPEDLDQENFQGINFVNLSFEFDEITPEGGSLSSKIRLPLIRPPVVLVHGTFDNPTNCWKTGLSPSGNGLYQELTRQGFKVFACDYSNTNGQQKHGFCTLNPLEIFDGSGINRRISSFECNKRVVYENPGGIREAVDFYRDSLFVACTQADAIGHSMGGVLIRVYASDRRSEGIVSYETDYYRPDNFEQGDINRIITMASTHHGSDVAWLLDQWSKLDLSPEEGFQFTDQLQLNGAAAGWWLGGIKEFTGAVRDQVPQSQALRRIGPTRIPAHAMTFYIDDIQDVKNDPADWEERFYYKRTFQVGLALYFLDAVTDKLLTSIALEWERLPQHLREPRDRFYQSYSTAFLDDIMGDYQKFKDLYKAPLEANFDLMYAIATELLNTNLDAFNSLDISLLQYETVESSINDFDNDEHQNFIDQRLDLIRDEYEVSLTNRDFEELEDLMNRYRFLIFKNDWNDGTVRYLSQTGSLEDTPYSSRFANHIHSYAPRYPDAMQRVAELLKGGMSEFAPDGFPNAGRRLPIWLPDMSEDADPDVTGCEAACWSGMVPDHAMAWARVADRENVIVLNRPVNPDATPLIFENAATKGMNLKGKSSDWGPQKGLIAVDQRFSKIWSLYEDSERDKLIEKFNKKVQSLLTEAPDVAEKRQLTKTYNCEFIRDETEFLGWITAPGADASEEIRFTPKSDMSTVYTWFDSDNDGCELVPCESNCDVAQLTPFEVLSNPDPDLAELNGGEAPVYTADYDLLAIGFFDHAAFNNPEFRYRRPTFSPPEEFFDCEIGIMFPEQQDLLEDLNRAVRDLGYTGGNVAHHGPENQFANMEFTAFPCSPEMGPLSIVANPYFDYPITAFEPDDDIRPSDGVVRAIQMGPPGYRDIFLKRYVAEKRRQGFDLIANPNSPSWQWEYWREYSYEEGFDDRDYPGMPVYPEELPRPNLQECLDRYGCLDRRPAQTSSENARRTKMRFKATDSFKIYPNPLADQPLQVVVKSEIDQYATLVLIDARGRVVHRSKHTIERGINRIVTDTQDLVTGMYFVSLLSSTFNYSDKLVIRK